MTSPIKDNGIETNDNDEIVNEVRTSYEQYNYKSRDETLEDVDLLKRLAEDTPKLSDDEAQTMEGKIPYEEAGAVLKNMKNNKSPGSDRYTVEFFKFFWKDLGHYLIKAINFNFNLKKRIKNWRPITLLNVAYKIASGCIARRIKANYHK